MDKERQVGLSVVKLINQQRADTLVTKQLGEVSFHTLRDYFIDLYQVDKDSVKQAINLYTDNRLKKLVNPTKTDVQPESTRSNQ